MVEWSRWEVAACSQAPPVKAQRDPVLRPLSRVRPSAFVPSRTLRAGRPTGQADDPQGLRADRIR